MYARYVSAKPEGKVTKEHIKEISKRIDYKFARTAEQRTVKSVKHGSKDDMTIGLGQTSKDIWLNDAELGRMTCEAGLQLAILLAFASLPGCSTVSRLFSTTT